MAYSVLPTVNANDTIATVTWGNVVKADVEYLLSRPSQGIVRDNGANYSTGSAVFVAIDSTNLSITLTCVSTKVELAFTGVTIAGFNPGDFDFTIDGTRVGAAGADGIGIINDPSANPITNAISVIATVTPGSHVFQPVWKTRSGGTTGVYCGNGVATEDYVVTFSVNEVG